MTLLELFGLMRKHLGLVIALPIVFALLTAAYSYIAMADQYTASTSMYVLTKSKNDSDSISNTDLTASQMLTNDVATLIKSSRVQQSAAEAVGLESLSGYSVSVDSTTTTRVITVKVTGASPANVAVVANQLAKTVDDIAKQVMDVQSINVIDEATEPLEPSGPPRLMYTAVAFLAGLFVAIAIIVIADMANTRVRSGEEAAELTGFTVIGRMPVIK
ncbi:MAG: lipopolysaccharide biosynthesis protein [Eggerthellaceae bacterium]|nr:lipopolysaccharide biosynthesis protein [Eggerthellaceae bacterium]